MNDKDRDRSSKARTPFRKADWTAVIGLAAILVGMLIFRVGMQFVPAWVAWLVAPLLWYSGFAFLTGWAFVRMLHVVHNSQRERSARKGDAELARPTQAPFVATSSLC